MSKNEFLNNMVKETGIVETTNGAIVYNSTFDSLLDFYSEAGSMRGYPEEEIIELFEEAYKEDKLRAIKCVFYLGDILGGQGERNTFRILIKHIANTYPEALKSNLKLIPKFNRWDSIYELFDTPLEESAIELIKEQLLMDLRSKNKSLCAKWLKSVNTSSKESNRLGKKTARLLNLGNFVNPDSFDSKKRNEFIYRKVLSALRKDTNVVETKMSSSNWDSIEYSAVPSKAMNIYQNAFYKHDRASFEEFANSLSNGDTKLNSKALYPYEIVRKILNGKVKTNIEKKIIEGQWNNLPNYITNPEMKGLCVVDVSGSMHGTPLEVAVSTGLYVAERCSGVYHNKFITFSERPKIVDIKGLSIMEKVRNIANSDWGYNTNLEAVFDLVLNTAVRNNAKQDDIPDYLIIISDMNWDDLESRRYNPSSYDKTFINTIKARFEEAGYEMPVLVLWNVDSSGSVPMSSDENGWISVSGYSPTIFKALLSEELLGADEIVREDINPIKAMLVVLDGDRYKDIII